MSNLRSAARRCECGLVLLHLLLESVGQGRLIFSAAPGKRRPEAGEIIDTRTQAGQLLPSSIERPAEIDNRAVVDTVVDHQGQRLPGNDRFALGGRAETDVIRPAATAARVAAVFQDVPASVTQRLVELGIPPDDLATLSREVPRSERRS